MKRSLMIYFLNSQNILSVGYELKMLIRRAVETTLDYEDFEGAAEVSVTFTDDEGIRKMNKSFRATDKATDVLSFPLENFDAAGVYPKSSLPAFLGDIVISLERAASQAEEYRHSFSREVAFLCVHSMLHLLGYDHITSDEDDVEMRHRQREILESMNL